MANNNLPKAVIELLNKHNMMDEGNFWKHAQSGKWILSHQACEKLAVLENITFDLPVMVETDMGKNAVCMVVGGHRGKRFEWSTGEASSKNCKNSYPYAMAEKRAKDRVVLKLLGVHGEMYSEEESESFSYANMTPAQRVGAIIVGHQETIRKSKGDVEKIAEAIQTATREGLSEQGQIELFNYASKFCSMDSLYDALGYEHNSANMSEPPL